MRERGLVGGAVVAATKKKKKKKRHLEPGRCKRSPCWLWTRRRSAYNQLDWTASRVFVVRPGVVRVTTGAGVGLPLLLLVVAVLGNQTCTTTAAPVVSDPPHVSLDATPPRLLPRSTDRLSSSSSSLLSSLSSSLSSPSSSPSSSPFPSTFRRAIYTRSRSSNERELDYHEVSLLPRRGEREDLNDDSNDRSRLLSATRGQTTIDTIEGRKDLSSPVATSGRGGEEGGGRGGRGGGLAHERTKSRRRQVAAASLLDDRGSTSLGLVEPYWLHTRFSRPRYTESDGVEREARRGGIAAFTATGTTGSDSTSSSLGLVEDVVGEEALSNENYSPTTATTTTSTTTTTTTTTTTIVRRTTKTATTVPTDLWTHTPFRSVHRTVPRLANDGSVNSGKLTAGRPSNRKAKDEEDRREVDISSGKDERGRFTFAGDASNSGEIKSGGGGGVVEWTTTVARPMSAWSYPDDEEPGVGNVRKRPSPVEAARNEDEEAADTGEEQVKVAVTQAKGSSSSSTTARTTSTLPTTTQLPPPSQDTSMEAREYLRNLLFFFFFFFFFPSFLCSPAPASLSRSDHQRESSDL
ncbi:mucin-19-like [Frieseomelitta varia]|uniref:mucin-19-like n=1 Tax=Frieseomelitta varia TaxID=561572 RepID=UPI001CB69C2B|nr:mucin-19-like [Frieseomelitta varia]